MNSAKIRQELSQLETQLKLEIGQLDELQALHINPQKMGMCELIALLTQFKLCTHPLFIRLTKLDASTCQLELGLYGLCSDCENEIEAERLALDITEQRCVQCAPRHAHQHRQELRLTH